ncbi:MAG: tyrosine--tRNA ligase [Candidatus Omnitrophica bacterium]|nr:tyrosine--tRNA ligase [Candidatus Omnitrophota bacterium]MDD5430079.1 tyrosine--tRNA ligase [Candidatus Omnitrophota bacterium]
MRKCLDEHLEAIKKCAIDVISEEEIKTKIEKSFKLKKPLRLKIGFDPTARDIHLGHTVLLRKLRKLQDLGHQVYLIIGDFTAKIGDPSGKTCLRPVLSDKEIKSNASTYTQQAFKVLDKKKTKVIYNSIWYKKMDLSRFLSLLSSYTVARILERDDFSQRLKENRPLTVLEIIYPLIQGYDSFKMEADIEFGGTDQKFNLIVGRHLQQGFGQMPQAVVTMPLLVGLDGKNKMSKSLDNYIGITESPKTMFGKIMSISDEVMWEYYKLLSDRDTQESKSIHPKEAKLALASDIVSFYHSRRAASLAKAEFVKVFSQKGLPEDIPAYRVATPDFDIIDVLYKAKLMSSKNEARRLLEQGAICLIDTSDAAKSTVVKNAAISLVSESMIFKVGKKRFLKVTL